VPGIWSLPGPARFAAAISARLERGYSVLVGLPAPRLSDAAFRAGLAAAVDLSPDILDLDPDAQRPLAALIAEEFTITDLAAGRDAPAALARHPTILGRVLLIVIGDDGDQAGRWAGFVAPFVAASRTVPADQRPRLIVLSAPAGHQALAGCDPLLSDIWWWGVLDRLDAALHVRGYLPDRGDGLLRDTVVEVAGFDLDLAGHLADRWDGAAATLPAALAAFGGAAPALPCPPAALPGSSTPLGLPPAPLLPLWDRGLIDAWDDFPAYWHPCAAPGSADLRSRIWRAQVRSLMPAIDEERARLESWLRTQVKGLPAEVLEPGDLYTALQDHPQLKTWRGGHRKRLIYWLRESRNTLAHMGTLTPAGVADGLRLIAADRRGG
jgi:hypothetical protein